MSRSIKKHPVVGVTHAESERADKVRAHHQTRARFRAEAAKPLELIGETFDERASHRALPHAGSKDGKQYLGSAFVREGDKLHIKRKVDVAEDAREAYHLLGK